MGTKYTGRYPKKKDTSKICTINLMTKDVNFVDYLVEEGYFLSRSACVRAVLHMFIENFVEVYDKLNEFKTDETAKKKLQFTPDGWKILGPTHIVKNKQNA